MKIEDYYELTYGISKEWYNKDRMIDPSDLVDLEADWETYRANWAAAPTPVSIPALITTEGSGDAPYASEATAIGLHVETNMTDYSMTQHYPDVVLPPASGDMMEGAFYEMVRKKGTAAARKCPCNINSCYIVACVNAACSCNNVTCGNCCNGVCGTCVNNYTACCNANCCRNRCSCNANCCNANCCNKQCCNTNCSCNTNCTCQMNS